MRARAGGRGVRDRDQSAPAARLADELAACLALEAQHGADGLRRAAAACVARDTCGAEYLLLFAGAQPTLALPDLPDQAAVDRDLAVYEAFVGR